MTDEQFARWQDFSRHMAPHHVDGAHIVACVDQFFRTVNPHDPRLAAGWEGTDDSDGVGTLCYDMAAEWIPDFDATPDEGLDAAHERWSEPVRRCLQAGFEAATVPSGLQAAGWAHGQLCAMYPEGVPTWVKDGWPTPFIDRSLDELRGELAALQRGC